MIICAGSVHDKGAIIFEKKKMLCQARCPRKFSEKLEPALQYAVN
jgi:hypothetical protein